MWYCPGIRLEKLSKATKNLSPLAGLRVEIWIRHLPKSVLYISLFCSSWGWLAGFTHIARHPATQLSPYSSPWEPEISGSIALVFSWRTNGLILFVFHVRAAVFIFSRYLQILTSWESVWWIIFGVTEGNSWNYFHLFFWSNTNFLTMFSPRTYCTRVYLY
jgi:hypothetical protein